MSISAETLPRPRGELNDIHQYEVVSSLETAYYEVAQRLDVIYAQGRYEFMRENFGVVRAELRLSGSLHGHTHYNVDQTAHKLNNSYKIHGAANAGLQALEDDPELEGFDAASAGNHGEAVAVVARCLGRPSTVRTAKGASATKLDLIRKAGGRVDDSYESLPDALTASRKAGGQPHIKSIEPYNDYDVIAGQAILGVNLVEDLLAQGVRGLVRAEIPVGGGGLKLGLLLGSMYGAAYARAAGIEVPFEVEFVGVQMHGGDPARRAVDRYRAGLPCDRLEDLYENDALIDKRNDGTFAVPGSITLPLLAKAGDIELVSSDEVGQAMLQLSSRYSKKIEPAGALSFAGARAWASRHPVASDKRNRVTLVTYTTGSNVTDENFMSFKADADKAARSRQAAENERVTSWNQQHYSFLPSDDARRLSAIVEGVRTRKQRRAAQAVGTASCSRGTRVWSGPTSVK